MGVLNFYDWCTPFVIYYWWEMIIIFTTTPIISISCLFELWRRELKLGYRDFYHWLLREGLTEEWLLNRWKKWRKEKRELSIYRNYIKPRLGL